MTDIPSEPVEEPVPEAPLPPPVVAEPATPEERVDKEVRNIIADWRQKRRAARAEVERLQTALRTAKAEVDNCEAIIARLKGFIGDDGLEAE